MRNALLRYGIEAFVTEDVSVESPPKPQVWVERTDTERAKAILGNYERRSAERRTVDVDVMEARSPTKGTSRTSETKKQPDPNTRKVALDIDGKFETGFVIRVPDDATDDELRELIPELICHGPGTRLEPDEITEVHLTNEGTVSESLGSEILTTLKRNPAGKLILAETITSEEIEKIFEETMTKLQNCDGTASVVVLIQASTREDVLVFHNCDAETAKGILADAWAKLDREG